VSAANPSPLPSSNPAVPTTPHAPPDDSEAIYYEGRPMLGGKPGQVMGLIALAIICLIFSNDAIDCALSVLRAGTMFLSKFPSR